RHEAVLLPAVLGLAALVETRERLRRLQVVPARPANEGRGVLVGVPAGDGHEALLRHVELSAQAPEVPEVVLRAVLVRHRDAPEVQPLQLGSELLWIFILDALQPPGLLPDCTLLHAGLGVAETREERHALAIDELGDEL